jgi:uncharacterized protein YggE
MNAKQLMASIIVITAAAGSAFAGENIEAVDQGNFVSTKSRAEVRAELDQAFAKGFRTGANTEAIEFTNVASTRTRDDVRKEAIQAAKNHENSNLYTGD